MRRRSTGDRADVVDRERGVRALHRVGADRERDVDAVVDDRASPRRRASAPEPAAEEGEVGGAEVLLADLDGGEAGGQALADDGDEVPAARLRAVSDEAEAQLVQSGRPSSGEDAVAYSFLPMRPDL